MQSQNDGGPLKIKTETSIANAHSKKRYRPHPTDFRQRVIRRASYPICRPSGKNLIFLQLEGQRRPSPHLRFLCYLLLKNSSKSQSEQEATELTEDLFLGPHVLPACLPIRVGRLEFLAATETMPRRALAHTSVNHGGVTKGQGPEVRGQGTKRMGRIFEKRKESIFKTAAQKSKLYSKYGKKLYMAAKNGVPDPEANPTLRSVVEKAKRENVPSHVIEKAIQKARGTGGEDFHPVRYEGFGPGGSLVIVDCLTDNNQRTISEVRNCFTKTGSKLAANGSVAHVVRPPGRALLQGDNEEQVLEAMFAADVAVEEVESKDGSITIFAPPAEFYKAKTALLEAFPDVELEVQEITFLPQATQDARRGRPGAFRKVPRNAARLRRRAGHLPQRRAVGPACRAGPLLLLATFLSTRAPAGQAAPLPTRKPQSFWRAE